MLGWSINLFRIHGIQLSIHATFFLLLAYAGWEGWQDGGGWTGLALSVGLTVLFFVCVVLHELGHSLTAKRYGVNVPRILLMPIGGMAEFDRIPRQPSAELLITIAGPAVNFAIALVLILVVGLPAGWPLHAEYQDTLAGVFQLLLTWNLLMGTFNLLPVFPMDGGRIFRALLARKLAYVEATRVAVMVGRVLALGFALLALFYFNRPMLGVLFAFIFFAGDAEYRGLLRREREAAYWAEIARRIAAATPPEPPPPPFLGHGPN
jgi:Zn-dependent protease